MINFDTAHAYLDTNVVAISELTYCLTHKGSAWRKSV